MKRRSFLFLALLCALSVVFYAAPGSAKEWKARVLRNITYNTTDEQEIKLNIALPEDSKGNLREGAPLFVWIDSGCWYSKGPGNGGFWAHYGLIGRGCAVASVATRSLENACFPAQIEDVKAAIRFLRAHADEYKIDKNRICVSGASSGGHLSNMLSMSDEQRIFDVGDNLEESSQANVVINFYGPTDFVNAVTRTVCTSCIYPALGDPKVHGRTMDDVTPELIESAKKYSPITYVTSKTAPTFTLHGAMDTTVGLSQAALYNEALRLAKVRCKLFISNTGVHSIPTLGSKEELGAMIFEFIGWEELKD